MSIQRFEYLFGLYLSQTITDAQRNELMEMLSNPDNQFIIQSRIDELYDDILPQHSLSDDKINSMLDTILAESKRPKVYSFRRIATVAAAVAAVVLIAVSGYHFSRNTEPQELAKTEIKAPSEIIAFITLSNGKKIAVSEISPEGATHVEGAEIRRRKDGSILYGEGAASEQVHTLENPAGSRIVNIQLSDGSKIALNSGSKISYPVAFTGAERKVTLSGEALFDIAHRNNQPFIVQKGTAAIKVLGTVFNVKAYEENKEVEVTLLKGRVSISNGNPKVFKILKPGQHAKIGSSLDVSDAPDIDAAVSWNTETFIFNNERIAEIGNTLSRWYNVDLLVTDTASANATFSGIFNRQSSLNETIGLLQAAGVNVKLADNKIIF
ncbi:FecR family protein [Niabella insulamsoli]|uniref:FecR family protein n=1 Tax=Niabella insulamsoli TaxID=3144874 RepID=UPI0031FC6303